MLKVTIFMASISCSAWAQAPAWTTLVPDDDSNYRYYVGRCHGTNEDDCVQSAFDDAKNQAILDNYGVTTNLSSAIRENSDTASSTVRREESSVYVLLKGFRLKDVYRSESDYWSLFSYRLSNIAAEKKRLAGSIGVGKLAVPIIGEKSGDIRISTDPTSASVFIDDLQYGFSTLRIYRQLSVGSHILRLEKHGYYPIEEKITIEPGTVLKIKRELRRDKNVD